MAVIGKNVSPSQAFALVLGLALASPQAGAFEFSIGDTDVKLDSLFTVGALMRMQERDPSLVGKSSLTPGICVARVGDDGFSGASRNGTNRYTGDTCTASNLTSPTTPSASNLNYVSAPGSFSPNGDDGNLNFDRGDIVHATSKITSDLSFSISDFNFFVRGIYLFDAKYNQLDQTKPDTTLARKHVPFSDAGKVRLGNSFDFLDYFVSRNFTVGERQVSVKVGNQVLNWGESSFLLANSLNSINPPDQSRLRAPGFDIKELQQPVGMLVINAELASGINLETFYQYEWKPIIADPVGSFFSTSDIVGDGGYYAMLSFGKAPEDPEGLYRPVDNSPLVGGGDTIGLFGSTASRTIYRNYQLEEQFEPSHEKGQFGAALKIFLEEFNGGTELGFYFANYHARVPSISAIAAQDTCLTSLATIITDCDVAGATLNNIVTALSTLNLGLLTGLSVGQEILPVNTVQLFIEYPEDIHMFGASFNTTIGDLAFSGEYVYRPNLPIQVHSTDLLFAALQPAFPVNAVGPIPGRRDAAPDFIVTNYRGGTVTAGQYIPGYERMEVGQLGLSLLQTIGGDNPIGASQITLLLEAGYTHLPGYPDLSEFQANGAETNTHISAGGDGTLGINPRDVRSDPNNPYTNSSNPTGRQNPTAWGDLNGFGTKESYGYRFVTLSRYDSALFGANLELLAAFFHDVEGTGPGLGQNFVQGRKQVLGGVRFDYLSKYVGEVRYSWFTGGGRRDALRDRDNLLVSLGYQF